LGATVQFDFGYRRKDVIMAFAPLLGALLLPLLWACLPNLARSPVSRCAGTGESLPRPADGPSPRCLSAWLGDLGLAALAAWLIWGILVVLFRGDQVLCFLAGLVQPLESSVGTIALLVVPPLALLALARRIKRHRLGERAGQWPAGLLAWITPALLAGVGLALQRQSGPDSARPWWLTAASLTAVILGQRVWAFAWPSARGLVDATEIAKRSEDRRHTRLRQLQGWWLASAIIVGIPVAVAWAIRYFRIEQPASAIAAGAGLLATLVILGIVRTLDSRKAKAEADKIMASADNGATREGAAPAVSQRGYRLLGALVTLGLRLGIAWVCCLLLDLPWDLEHGDEGLFALACVAVAAGYQAMTSAQPTRGARSRP
jgi:hypothetical protein